MNEIPQFDYIDGHKPKLPREYAWVVGVESLSKRFAHVPQFDRLRVWFTDRPMEHDFRMDEIVREKMPYEIFTVWYSATGQPTWYFMVYPVVSKKRAQIRAALQETAFPRVDAWMCEAKPETWLAQSKHLRCILDQTENRITIKEENC